MEVKKQPCRGGIVIPSPAKVVLIALGVLVAGLAGTTMGWAPGGDNFIRPLTPALRSRACGRRAGPAPDGRGENGQKVLPAEADDSATPPLYAVRIARAWIPMKDGVRLAVNLFLPVGAKPEETFPALLEYLPYRKDDWSKQRDYGLHSYFVRRGYVAARVDIRGTGASEGQTPEREYSEQEQLDGLEVIAWLARQPWSNGNVGMLGISWGGFNSIQLAMRHPPALKAILAVDATEQLFHDDIHYIDGMMHADEFELAMDLSSALTRAPDFPVDEQSLAARFDRPPWFLLYLRHQRDGEFWKIPVGALDALRIPAFLIGGLFDGYRDSVPRMLERVKAPVKAIIGPWNHTFPHDAAPGPAVEWRDQAVGWWDHWLKNRENGVLNEPRLAVYMRHWYPPDLNLAEIPGEWRCENGWPPAGLHEETLYLQSDHRLTRKAPTSSVHHLKYISSVGVEAGFWWGDLTPDQRPVDAFSLAYDSAPLSEETAVLGRPRAILQASATAPVANWFVRLSDVAPDGTTTLVAGAGLNGTQRDSPSDPRDLDPGRFYSLEVDLHFTSWVFPRGHRVRVGVSNALWPMIWPTPYAMTTALQLGGREPSRLVLPVVPLKSLLPAPSFRPPVVRPDDSLPGLHSSGETWPGHWTVERDEARQATRVEWRGDDASEFPWGKEKDHEQLTYEVADARSDISSVHGEAETDVDLPDRALVWRTQLDLSSDKTHFFYRYTRELLLNGELIRQKSWDETIPRDHH